MVDKKKSIGRKTRPEKFSDIAYKKPLQRSGRTYRELSEKLDLGFKIRTRNDFIEAAKLIAHKDLKYEDITFAEYITDDIKINSEFWGRHDLFDYRVSMLATAIQEDIIGIYNSTLDEKISLKNIDKNDYLIVKFRIEKGSISLKTLLDCKVLQNIFGKYAKMNSRDKIITGLIICALFGIYMAPDIIRAIRREPALQKEYSSEEVVNTLVKNQRVQMHIAENIGTGSISLNNGETFRADEIQAATVKKLEETPQPAIQIDDDFIIVKYDFKKQETHLFHHSGKSFTASTKWLPEFDRDRLSKIVENAVKNKSAAIVFLNLSCSVTGNKIKEAIVNGIDMPKRNGSKNFVEASMPQNKKNILQQLSLLK